MDSQNVGLKRLMLPEVYHVYFLISVQYYHCCLCIQFEFVSYFGNHLAKTSHYLHVHAQEMMIV